MKELVQQMRIIEDLIGAGQGARTLDLHVGNIQSRKHRGKRPFSETLVDPVTSKPKRGARRKPSSKKPDRTRTDVDKSGQGDCGKTAVISPALGPGWMPGSLSIVEYEYRQPMRRSVRRSGG